MTNTKVMGLISGLHSAEILELTKLSNTDVLNGYYTTLDAGMEQSSLWEYEARRRGLLTPFSDSDKPEVEDVYEPTIMDVLEKQSQAIVSVGEVLNQLLLKEQIFGDSRYLNPKETPKVSQEKITQTIEDTRIYNEAKEIIINAQRKQVAYGIEKYPEPLNSDTWTTGETIDHIIDESIDKLHYLVMLKIKLGHEEAKKSE